MVFKALRGLKPINPLGRILGVKKDRYGKNMAIEPEKFETKVNKFKHYNNKKNTGADFIKIADELDDEQLETINSAYKQKDEADNKLKPFGLGGGDVQDSWFHWRTDSIQRDRLRGERKEKNPRK